MFCFIRTSWSGNRLNPGRDEQNLKIVISLTAAGIEMQVS